MNSGWWLRRLGAFVAAAVVLFASQGAWAKAKVVATLPDLAAIAREVGGDQAEVTCLSRPNEDPHYVDAKPSFLVSLNQADLLLLNGMELEVGWLPPLLTQARNPKIQVGAAGYVDASRAIQPLEVPASVDRAQGDIHAQGNPHYMLDPRRGLLVAELVRKNLSAIDPGGAPTYQKNYDALKKQLDELAKTERERFMKLSEAQRQVVPFHRSVTYLSDWLGLKTPLEVQPKPGIAPTPSHTAKVLQTLKGSGVRALIQEEFYPRNTSETLSKLSGARLVVFDGGTRFQEGERYAEHLKKVSAAIYGAIAP